MRLTALLTTIVLASATAAAQDPGMTVPGVSAKRGGNDKMHMLARVPANPGAWKAADVEMEQEKGRPYVYLSGFVNFNAQIYDISNPSSPKKVYEWSIDNPELHRGIGAMDGKYFKIKGRYYYAQSLQFFQGSPDADL